MDTAPPNAPEAGDADHVYVSLSIGVSASLTMAVSCSGLSASVRGLPVTSESIVGAAFWTTGGAAVVESEHAAASSDAIPMRMQRDAKRRMPIGLSRRV